MKTAAAPPSVALDDRLCLALYTASRAMTARYRPILAELGLTYPQYLVMVLLWEDGTSTVGAVGRRLSLDSSTLSPLLKRLEVMDLITRVRDPRDQRAVNLALTTAGSKLRKKATGVPVEICAATALSDAQQAKLVGRLRQLATDLETSLTNQVVA